MLKKISLICLLMVVAGVAFASEGSGEGAAGSSMTHRMMMLVIQLGVILFAAKLGSILFEKLKMPGVLGELMAGVVLGPYLLGSMSLPGLEAGLFPVHGVLFPVSPELYGICSIASIVLLFMVGLETDLSLFLRYSIASSLVGIGGVAASFLIGDFTAVLLLRVVFHSQATFWSPECLMLGVISTATSVGITARVLSERRQIDSPEGVTILAGAVIDDVLGIVMLAVTMGVISASKSSGAIDWANIGLITAKAIGIWLSATVVSLLLSRRISILLKYFQDRSSIAIMALGLALILAGLFEGAGLAMIVGAYIMGLALSQTDISHVIMEKLGPIYRLLIPVFFAVMGMLVDFKAFSSPRVIILGSFYTVGAIVAKMVGCGVPALFCNFNIRGALRIGFGMLPRGEVALIIAGIGLSSGILAPEYFSVSVIMTMVTTLIAPVALVQLFKNPASGMRKEVKGRDVKELAFTFPSTETADLLLNKLLHILESDGFYVHLLDRNEGLYQFRKDDVVIGLKHGETDIVFSCVEKDVALVNTAMMEVLAELEQTVRELRKPVDVNLAGRNIQEETNGFAGKKSLAKFITPSVLTPEIKGNTKEEILDELLELLRKSGRLKDVKTAKAAIMSREESMSTGMQYGVAIPHGRTDAVSCLTCAIGVKAEGADFDSIDGKPSTIIVLTLSPKSAVAPHVQFMSIISQTLNKEGREAILACKTSLEMFDVLTGRKTGSEIEALIERESVLEMSRVEQERKSQLAQYLHKDLVKLELQGKSKADVINELLGMLNDKGLISNMRAARAALMAREKQMSSGLAHGVAIPHARTNEVKDLVCAVGIKHGGVDFDAMDSQLCNIIVLTLSPQDVPAPHVQFMAMVSRSLNEEGRKRVLAARSNDELYDAIVSG